MACTLVFMQNITLYEAPMSSATPVVWAFNELGINYERITFTLAEGKHKQPEFLALNPNGKVPTVVVDGTPMFETLAITTWLGDTFGVERGLWPAMHAPARLTAVSWSTWAYVTYGAAIHRLNYAGSPHAPAELHSPGQVKAFKAELKQLLAILEPRVAKTPYILGHSFSLADLMLVSSITYGTYCGASVDGFPSVQAYLQRAHERPAFKQTWG